MVIKGMATWLSRTEAEVSTQATGIGRCDIDMQLIADPCLLIALAVLLGADIARGGEIGE